MAANLGKFGHRLIVYDRDQHRAQQFSRLFPGAEFAKTPREVAAACRIVFSMLPGAAQVEDVCMHPETGIFLEATKRSLFIDSSTIEPEAAKKFAGELEKRCSGAKFVDAPVSGGVPGAVNRKLTFMVGNNSAAFARIESLLKCMGQKIISCGDVGSGQVAKMCNNLILGITMMGVSEAMSLASHLDMDAKALTDVINVSSGRCWSTDTYHPVGGVMENVPSSRDYENGFTCDLMLKDLNIALKEAKRVNASSPVCLLVTALYKLMSDKGHGKKDFSGIYKYFYQDSGGVTLDRDTANVKLSDAVQKPIA